MEPVLKSVTEKDSVLKVSNRLAHDIFNTERMLHEVRCTRLGGGKDRVHVVIESDGNDEPRNSCLELDSIWAHESGAPASGRRAFFLILNGREMPSRLLALLSVSFLCRCNV